MALTRSFSVLRPVICLQICIAIVHSQMLSGMMGGTTGGMMGGADPVLRQAVREIVHPMAQPTPQMIAIANRAMRPPSTVGEVMQYTPHMTQLARQFGVRPPGTIGNTSYQALYNYMLQRGIQWLQRRGATGQTYGGGFGNMLMWSMLMDNI